METKEYLELVERRDQLHKVYLDAKTARDDARERASRSLSEHRSRLLEVSSIKFDAQQLRSSIKTELQAARNKLHQMREDAQREFHETQARCQEAQLEIVEQADRADKMKADSLSQHRDALTDREKTERACADAWHEYREVDGSIPEARLQMLGLDGL